MNKPTVHFVKWRDPFQVQEEDYPEDLVDQELRDMLQTHQKQRQFKPGGFHVGPMGFIPVAPQNAMSELYDMWVMHTNFNLNQQTLDVIKRVPGVEIFHLWTRYRGWLGVGRAFDSEQVHVDIREALSNLYRTPPLPSEEDLLARSATSSSWAIFKSPAGNVRLAQGRSREEVVSQMSDCEIVSRASWISY